MKKTLRNLASMLAALMLMTALLTACSEDADNSAETTENGDLQQTAETTTAEPETTIPEPDIPEMDFNGAEFVIFVPSDDYVGKDWDSYDVHAKEENGDVINDAVYARNLYINEKYNVKITEAWSKGDAPSNLVSKVVLAGEDVYDVVDDCILRMSALAQKGHTINLYDVPYIDLTQPWWNGNMAEALSVAGSINYINGDILLLDNDATWVLMFNKGMAEDYSLGSIYELVDNDEWYYDKMDEMMKKVASDLNGDGEMTWENDRFSIATSLYSGNSLYYNFGTTISAKDSDDLPIYALDESRGALIAERMGAMMADESSLIDRADDDIDSESLRQVFESGRALFYGEVLQCMIRMRGSETDFGVVPWPKLDEAQDDYGHVGVSIVVMSIAVPKTNTDLEMTGLLLEAMAAKSMSTLTPAYYDVTLTGKAMRDEESTRMLDIILGTIKHDIAFVYDWNGFSNKLRDVIVKNTGNFSSLVASEKTAFEKAMQDTIDAYLEAAK